MSFAIFNEQVYLQNYPDVKAAVDAGVFPSGLNHFQQFGLAEGRTSVSSQYDESAYLAANPDVAAAVQNGILNTGLEHYIFLGEAEGRSLGTAPSENAGAGFNEQAYLITNPDVANAVSAGVFSSGLEHYQAFGQFEGRLGLFTGTPGSDRITGFGQETSISGVGVEVISLSNQDAIPTSLGVGEIDTLIGTEGEDSFFLGVGTTPSNPTAQSFYLGNGDADFARVQNFDPNRDYIHLAGDLNDYQFEPNNGSLNISNGGDLVAIVEGVSALETDYISQEYGIFILKGSSNMPDSGNTGSGFNEEIYLLANPDVANAVETGNLNSGLEHYQAVGQFEGRVAAFTGTSGNDRITAFGQGAFVSGVGIQLLSGSIDNIVPTSLGVGEMDTLIGGNGQDAFYLAFGDSPSSPGIKSLYVGNGDADFARIQNFDTTGDILFLGSALSNYQLQEVNGGLNISTSGGDLVAIVEGISAVELQMGSNVFSW